MTTPPVPTDAAIEAAAEALSPIVPNSGGVVWMFTHEDGQEQPVTLTDAARAALTAAYAIDVPTRGCVCPPCPGRGNDGHGMTHCAECCFGSGVEADIDCPVHGEKSTWLTAHDAALTAQVREETYIEVAAELEADARLHVGLPGSSARRGELFNQAKRLRNKPGVRMRIARSVGHPEATR